MILFYLIYFSISNCGLLEGFSCVTGMFVILHPCKSQLCVSAMSKAAVKISTDLLSNPLCEQDQTFLESMTALDTAMKRMDSFNQEKVRPYKASMSSTSPGSLGSFMMSFNLK